MSKQFVKGNVYVFTKKKYLEDRCKYHPKSVVKQSLAWVNLVNGNEVEIENDRNGKARSMYIHPEWCKCIKNNNPKIES